MISRFLSIILLSCFFSCSEEKKEKITISPIKIDGSKTYSDSIITQDTTQYNNPDTLSVLPEHKQLRAIKTVKSTSNRFTVNTVNKDLSLLTPQTTQKKSLHQVKELRHSDVPPHGSLNTRKWLILFFNSFNEGDYISGSELALYYEATNHLSHVTKSSIVSFLRKNIKRITKEDNHLVFSTFSEEGIRNSVHIPLLVDITYIMEDGSSLSVSDTFISAEGEFKGWPMLPVEIKGITLIQKKDTIPNHGYINNNAYFINYPESKLNYKIHK